MGCMLIGSGCNTVSRGHRLQDWLFLAYQRVRGVEYGLLVATFIAIMVSGLELGIAFGIVAASLLFAYNYSKVFPPPLCTVSVLKGNRGDRQPSPMICPYRMGWQPLTA